MSLRNARRTWERLKTADLPGYVDPAVFKVIREEFQNVFEELDYLRGVVSGLGVLGATSMTGTLHGLTLTATQATFSSVVAIGNATTSGTTSSGVRVTMNVNGQTLYILASTT